MYYVDSANNQHNHGPMLNLINLKTNKPWHRILCLSWRFQIFRNKITVTSFSIIIENDKKEILLIKLQHNIFDAVKLPSTATKQSEAVNQHGCCSKNPILLHLHLIMDMYYRFSQKKYSTSTTNLLQLLPYFIFDHSCLSSVSDVTQQNIIIRFSHIHTR